MTFPTVAARTTTAEASAAFSHSVALGSPSAGDLLIVWASTTSAGGAYRVDEAASGSDWLLIQQAGASQLRCALLAKIASGGDVLTLLTPASVRMAAVCYRITGHGSTVAGGSFAFAVTGANGDPPNAAITGSAQDVLFLTALATSGSVASSAPASYASLTTASSGTAFMSSAERTLNGTSDNPAAFTSSSQEWIATTVAIPELNISTNARLTQAVAETSSSATPNARATQVALELISQVAADARFSQVALEMVSTNVPDDLSGGSPVMLFIAA